MKRKSKIKIEIVRSSYLQENLKTIKDKTPQTILTFTSFLAARSSPLTLQTIREPHLHNRLLSIKIELIWQRFKIHRIPKIN